MNETTSCNNCGNEFTIDESRFGAIKKDDLVVQYFSCPSCGERYHVFTTDSKMRELVKKRKAAQMKIQAAFAKKFREKVIREYERELEQIKKVQYDMSPTLKRIGEELIRGEEGGL